MNTNEIVVIGSSDVFEIIEDVFSKNNHKIIGYISLQKENSSTYTNYEYLGNDDSIKQYAKRGCKFVLSMGNNRKREQLFKKIKEFKGKFLTVSHHTCAIYKSAKIGEGCVIAPLSVVSAKAEIGLSTMIGYQSLVGHDVIIGDFSFLAPGAKILNRAEIGNNVIIGANAVIMPKIKIGNNVKIAANTTIAKNIEDNMIIMNSSRILKMTGL